MTEDNLNGDDPVEVEEGGQSGISVGITPFGHLGMNIQDANGELAGHVITDPNEAWILAGHIQSIATMMVQARYAMAMKEKEVASQIMQGTPEIWRPGQ